MAQSQKYEISIDYDTKRRGTLQEIDRLFERLDQNQNIDQIRLDIADLIAKCLNKKRDTFGYWEKAHMANAIAFLALNVASSSQSTTSWLRASLVNIEKAFVLKDQRSESYTRKDNRLDLLTFDQLLDDIRKLGGTPTPNESHNP